MMITGTMVLEGGATRGCLLPERWITLWRRMCICPM